MNGSERKEGAKVKILYMVPGVMSVTDLGTEELNRLFYRIYI
jgi:hypothetical protein